MSHIFCIVTAEGKKCSETGKGIRENTSDKRNSVKYSQQRVEVKELREVQGTAQFTAEIGKPETLNMGLGLSTYEQVTKPLYFLYKTGIIISMQCVYGHKSSIQTSTGVGAGWKRHLCMPHTASVKRQMRSSQAIPLDAMTSERCR